MATLRFSVYHGVVLADLADFSSRHAHSIPMRALLLAAALPGLEVGL